MVIPEEGTEEKGQGYVDLLVRVSLHLLRKGFAHEIRRQGLKLMLHLLRSRWDELRIEEWSSNTDILSSKSYIAALMAEVISSGGISLLKDSLPSIIGLSKGGPTEAELADFILKRISDFPIVCGVDREGGGDQDGDATQPFSASYTMPSSPSSYLMLGPHLSCENSGLSVALSCFHDLPTTQPSFSSCSTPFPKPNSIACTLNRKKLDHNLVFVPQLYYAPFPLHGSVPISWLGSGTKSQSRNEGKSLNLSPEYQISTENCSSSSLAGSISPCLALVKQRLQLHAIVKVLTHVSPSTQVGEGPFKLKFDDCGQGNDQEQDTVQGIATGDFEGSTESVHKRKLGILETRPCHEEKSQPLLVEHNILSEAFVIVTSFPRFQDSEHLISDLLYTLNRIWTLPDWEGNHTRYIYHLSALFYDDQFTRTFRSLVKSFEEELRGNRIVESAGAQEGRSSACTLPKLMLPLILRVLNCIQILWDGRITYDLSGAKNISLLLENGKLTEIAEAELSKNARIWLQEIRETGYTVIGLCASVDGAFYELLDSSCIVNVLMRDLRSTDFYHSGKLILLVLIPLVKYCPQECWDEWMVELLEPLFSFCEEFLYYAWFTFLHEGRAKVPAYFGYLDGPDEIVKQLEKVLLLRFTRAISDLLEVLASERLNIGLPQLPFGSKNSTEAEFKELKSISSSSLIGFLLYHNCFGRLSMYLFGCLADYKAAKKALPFCYALIRIAIATKTEWLNQFIINEMLPIIILLLGDLPCVISELSSSLNSTAKEDARNDVSQLCHHIYEVYIDKQVIVGDEGADRENMSGRFEDWLAKQFADVHKRASCSVPKYFPEYATWNWEFNEEFERYLPAYMNMLDEVDALNDCFKNNYFDRDILDKLKPEFKSRYGINSIAHPYMSTMSRMLMRKRRAVCYQSRTKWISQLLTKLITLKPYIKLTDSWESAMKHLQEDYESQSNPFLCHPARAVDILFDSILCYWEPQFYPLIRESHKELLTAVACRLASAEEGVFEPLEPESDDFVEHLQSYACMYIKRRKEEYGYNLAKDQVRLHEEFDNYLASGTLDHCMNEFGCSKDDFVLEVFDSDFKDTKFERLNQDLMKMSFERRAKFVEWERQISSYSKCLTSILKSDEMKNKVRSLMNVLNEEGFFRVNDDAMDWDNKLFSESVDKFNELVFSEQRIDNRLVIQGIMDCQKVLQMKDVDRQDASQTVFSSTEYSWKKYLGQLWVTTRQYEHDYYDTLARPLQKFGYAEHLVIQPENENKS
ncbi:hypothetical protein ACP70R_021890 [Stipagrostis hirtigluma subsp. patula]